MLPHAIVHAAIASTVVNVGTPPTPRDFTAVEAAQVGMVWRIARRLAFVAAGNTWATFLDVDPCEVAPAAQHDLRHVGPAVSTLTPALGMKVKIASILDQGDDGEVAQASATQVETWFQVYITVKRSYPAEEEEPTASQLTALHHR
eukprot:387895-Heterocapsa_arctica.AAC.1